MKEIMIFVDLDDTLFQTKRKKENGIFQATYPANPENISYMTDYQKLFIDLLSDSEKTVIVPVTARDNQQYFRTDLSRNSKVKIACTYFGGQILEDNKPLFEWESFIKESYEKINPSMNDIFNKVYQLIDHELFNLTMSEHYYLVIKNKNKLLNNYKIQNEKLKVLLSGIISDNYFLHHNDNNISILPKFIDKKNAVEYLIKKYKPVLTIGVGDSLTDLGFMSLCNFKIIPNNSQIDQLFFVNK